MGKHFRISEVAKLTGLNPKTIRYYEDIKVIPNARRTVVPHGMGYRLYSEQDLRRLAFVKQAKLLNLSLSEIRELVTAAEEGCCTSLNPKVGLFIDRKLGEIDKRISELEALRKRLTELQRQTGKALIKPERTRQEPVIFNVPCQDDICKNAKPSRRNVSSTNQASKVEERR